MQKSMPCKFLYRYVQASKSGGYRARVYKYTKFETGQNLHQYYRYIVTHVSQASLSRVAEYESTVGHGYCTLLPVEVL